MKKKAFLSVALATGLLLSVKPVSADQVTDLQNQKSTAQQKKSQLQSQLNTVKTNISALQAKIDSLNAQITKNLNDITATQNKINDLQNQIVATQKKIDDTQVKLDQKKAILAENLRVMYSQGKVSYIEFLFRADSMSDFLYRFNTLTDVAKANQALYDEVKTLLNDLQTQKQQLDNEKADVVNQQNGLVKLKATLEVNKQQQLVVMKELDQQQASLNTQIKDEDDTMSSIDNQIAKIIAEREAARKAAEAAKNASVGGVGNEIKSTGSWMIPVPQGSYYIASPFGWRNIGGTQEFHAGVDFAVPLGTPIYAVDNGTVLFAGPATGFGEWIVIDHNNGLYSIYGHMYANELYVKPGQVVVKGQHIADSGNNGHSTGPHVHFGGANGFNGSTFNYIDPMTLFK